MSAAAHLHCLLVAAEQDLAVKCRKKLKKGTIDQGDANVLEDEMTERHEAELAALPAAADAEGGAEGGGDGGEEGGEEEQEEDEGERKRRKAREKAARKAAKQREAEAEREARIEAEMAAIGPLPRDVENAAILRRLSQFGDWRVKEIPSDGHCMYRAIADQLCLQDRLGDFGLPAAGAHAQLRKRAAQHMLANPANFQPFCTADDFSVYCREVEATAQWGSQMELQALCHSLRTEIWVHAADSEVIKMGTEYAEEGSARALQVTYHLHYYAMGEHYNSVATGSM